MLMLTLYVMLTQSIERKGTKAYKKYENLKRGMKLYIILSDMVAPIRRIRSLKIRSRNYVIELVIKTRKKIHCQLVVKQDKTHVNKKLSFCENRNGNNC